MREPTITKEQAIALYETGWWEKATPREIAQFGLEVKLLCCPFDVFHAAVEVALGRPVYTHEFGLNWDGMRAELAGEAPAPTMEQIIEMIPPEKRVLVSL